MTEDIKWCPLAAAGIPSIVSALRSTKSPPAPIDSKLAVDVLELLENYLLHCENAKLLPSSTTKQLRALMDGGPTLRWTVKSRALLRLVFSKARKHHCKKNGRSGRQLSSS